MEAAVNQGEQIRVSYGWVEGVGVGEWGSPITNVITQAVVCGSSLQGEQLAINLGQESGKTSTPDPLQVAPLPPKRSNPGVGHSSPPADHTGGGGSIPVNGYAHMKGVRVQTERWVRNTLWSDRTHCRKSARQD